MIGKLRGVRVVAVVALSAALTANGCGSDTVVAGGAGGEGGGGTSPWVPFPAPCGEVTSEPVCDTDEVRCGNGMVDTCELCWSTDGQPVTCQDFTEACDGAPSASCAELGYTGGQVVCSELCSHDVRDCNSCLSPPNQVACARPRVDAHEVIDIALASDGNSVAAAWVSFNHDVYFARFSPELELLDYRPCSYVEQAFQVSLAPHPGGWLLAVGTGVGVGEVYLQRLDDGGTVLSTRTIENAMAPSLAARSGTSPLLVYADSTMSAGQNQLSAELLDDAAAAQWHTDIDTAFMESVAVAFADPGFLVGYRNGDLGSQLLPLSVDGSLGAPRDLGDIVFIHLEDGANNRVAAFWRDGNAFAFSWLDGEGQTLSEVEIAPQDQAKANQQLSLAVVDPAGSPTAIVALLEHGNEQVSVTHVDAAGAIATAKYALAYEPLEVFWMTSTGWGEGAALAWAVHANDPAAARFVVGRLSP